MSKPRVTRGKAIGYDEKIMAELKLDNSKSPMDKLCEILKKSNKTDVVYEVLNVKRSSYGNTYIIKASNREISAIGQGTMMSTAKTNAAFNLLSQIYGNVNIQIPSNFNDDQLPSTDCQKICIETFNKSRNSIISSINDFNDSSSKNIEETIFCNICHSPNPENEEINETIFCNICHSPSPKNKKPAQYNSKIFLEINFIDLVQEFCVAHCLQLPEYFFSQEISEKCIISYTVICSLLHFKTSGKENSKQLAKRYAAYVMHLCIENRSEIEIDIFKQKKSNYKSSRESLMSISKDSYCHLSSKSIERLEIFLSKNDLSDKILVDILDLIAKDEGFSVNYIEISKNLDNYIVLIQLLTDSILACVGSGKTMVKAKCSAIRSMLVWLQSVAKRSLQKIE